MRKIEKKVPEPKKEEVKRSRVKIPKAKKYEELPEIPDYERPELEEYEESEFDPTKPGQKQKVTAGKVPQQGTEKEAEVEERSKVGVAKVLFVFYSQSLYLFWVLSVLFI